MEGKYIVDTSVVIEGVISKLINNKEISGKILVPKAVLAELEHQANLGQEIGSLGLEELQKLQGLKEKGIIELDFIGIRPNVYQIQYAKAGGEIDSMIRDLAYSEDAVLITADRIQSESAKATGVKVRFIEFERQSEKLSIEKYFDNTTMSVHIKDGTYVVGKKGLPGNWQLTQISDKKLTALETQNIAKEIIEKTRADPKSFIEIAREGSTIVQYKSYRIVIVRPPVADGWEITVVKPLKKLNLAEYNLPEVIAERIKTKARGIIVAGETGSGKCLPKGTKIYLTGNDIKKIEEIKVGDEVLTYDKNCKISSNKVKRCFKRSVNKTIDIITDFGKEIILTQEHPVLSFRAGIPTWVRAEELQIGEKIATVRKLDSNGKLQETKWLELLPEDGVLIELNEDIELKIALHEKFTGIKSKIIKVIEEHEGISSLEIYKIVQGYKEKTLCILLLNITKEGLILRSKSKPYTYKTSCTNSILKKGDKIPLKTLKKYLRDEEIYDLTDKIYKFDQWHICESIKPPKYLTKEVCELLGYYLGESLTKYGISTDSKFCRDRFVQLSKNIFDIEVCKERRVYDVYTDKYGTIEMFLNKCFSISKFKSEKRATHHKIPLSILKSPKIELASFLRAYFDTECYVHKDKGIEISSASIELIKNTQTALLNFNIQTTLRKKNINNKPYYLLYLYGYETIKRFNEEIGLVEKRQQIEYYLKNNRAGSPNKDTIPLGYLLNNVNERENLSIKYPYLKREFSHEYAQKMISLMSQKAISTLSIAELAIAELAASEYIQWDEVVSIADVNGYEEVYDIEVENTHNFLAGDVPFLVHNSTFAMAVGEYYCSDKKIVKTVESPRDLILPDEITQYSKNFTTSQEIHDILFLSRPDNIIFDEIRDTPDFKLFTDLRLAGSNCLGVLHSASPIDAVQRFIGRLETGMIPSVLDTIIFIEKGAIGKVLTLRMTVKVPNGMTEADLARPVVEIIDFITNKPEYEIYSYGEETVVIPISSSGGEKTSPAKSLAAKQIENEFRKYTSKAVAKIISDHKAVVYVPKDDIAKIIGKQGKTINEIEQKIGIGIDIEELEENGGGRDKTEGVEFSAKKSGNYILFYTKPNISVDVSVNGQFLLTASSSKNGEIKIKKKSKTGRTIEDALSSNRKIELKE